MTVVDLHPEELLERDQRGGLSDDQREQLDAHLARCLACKFETIAREDFAREIDLDEPLDELVAELVAKSAAELDAAKRAPEPKPRRRRQLIALAVAAVLLAGAAIAAWTASRAPTDPPTPSAQPSDPPTRVEAPQPLPGERTEEPAPSPDEPVERADPETDTTPTPAAPAPAPPIAEAPPAPKETAADLFGRANRARRAGSDAEAIRLYQELQRRFPDSREAQVSRATLARMLLDKKDPGAALEEYDRYLGKSGKGELSEEALVGRARALQKLGNAPAERAAWHELLRRFPNSIHAGRARARLAELSGP